MTHAWLVYCLRGPKGSPTSRSDPPAWNWDREKSCRSQTPAAAVVRSLGWGGGKAKVVEKLFQTDPMPWEEPVPERQAPVLTCQPNRAEGSTEGLRAQDCGISAREFQD